MKRKIALASRNFLRDFKTYLPDITVIENVRQVPDYDIILFPGGNDVDPDLYGEYNKYCIDIDTYRDNWESEVFSEALNRGKKLVGICRGSQFLNVKLGGSLYQDIKEQTGEYHPQRHELSWNKPSYFKKFFKDTVISTHHQGIFNVSRYLTCVAYYRKIAELCVGTCGNSKVLTIQFHPEFENWNPSTQSFFDYLLEEW